MHFHSKSHKRWRWSQFLNKILIVDQSEFDCIEMAYALKQKGYTHIFTASDIKGALAQIEEYQPDLVLCNVNLPDGDGFTLCDAVHNLDIIPPKVVFLGDDTQKIDFNRSKQCGAVDFLLKTKDFEHLPQVLHDLMAH